MVLDTCSTLFSRFQQKLLFKTRRQTSGFYTSRETCQMNKRVLISLMHHYANNSFRELKSIWVNVRTTPDKHLVKHKQQLQIIWQEINACATVPDTLGCKSYIYRWTTQTKRENEQTVITAGRRKNQVCWTETDASWSRVFFLDTSTFCVLFFKSSSTSENYFTSLKTKNKHVHNHWSLWASNIIQ